MTESLHVRWGGKEGVLKKDDFIKEFNVKLTDKGIHECRSRG